MYLEPTNIFFDKRLKYTSSLSCFLYNKMGAYQIFSFIEIKSKCFNFISTLLWSPSLISLPFYTHKRASLFFLLEQLMHVFGTFCFFLTISWWNIFVTQDHYSEVFKIAQSKKIGFLVPLKDLLYFLICPKLKSDDFLDADFSDVYMYL